MTSNKVTRSSSRPPSRSLSTSRNPRNKTKEKLPWKQRIAHELIRYWVTVAYLSFFLGAFTWYRRLILGEYHITYLHYWVAIVEALVLAKVILIGEALRLGREFEHRPLIFSVLHKAVIFSLFVGLIAILEHTIDGLIHGKNFAAGFHEIIRKGRDELLARCLLTFFAFIPFFAFRELERVLGDGKLRGLFFHRR